MNMRPVVVLLVLSSCAPPPPPAGQARADAATYTACREHADQVYDRQYRESIYTIPQTNTPFSGTYAPRVDAGLSQRYVRENMVRDCVRNTGLETDRAAGATQAASPAPRSPPSPAAPPRP